MGDIENQSLYFVFIVGALVFSLFFRVVYYYFIFCTPYFVKNYSHLVEEQEVVDYFLDRRESYIFLSLFLFYVFGFLYFVILMYLKGWVVLLFVTIFLVTFFILEAFIKNLIFIKINKYIRFLGQVVGIIRLFNWFLPIISIFMNINNFVLKLFEEDIKLNKKYFAESIVYLDDFDWDDYKIEIIEKFLSMNDTLVREIMIPRVDIVAFEAKKTVSEVVGTIMKYGYSKYPVYEDTIDNIIGVVFLKDMLRYLLTNQGIIRLKDIARIPLIIPETKNIYELLKIMKQNRSSIAIVVDEYGGTSGCVTINDLIQELIGSIKDEHDKDSDQEDIQKISNTEYIVNSKIDIYTLEEYLGMDFPDKEEREYTTLAGLIYTKLGRVPKEGEVINIDDTITLKILEIRKNKINKVLIKIE